MSQLTRGKRVFVGEWSGPAFWQVRGPLPECVTDDTEPASVEAKHFIVDALAAAPSAEPVTFGEPYEAEPYDFLIDPWVRRVRAEVSVLLVADAAMVEMLEAHCGEGEWRHTDKCGTARGMFVYVVGDEPQAFLAPRAPDRQDREHRDKTEVSS